MTHGRQHIPAIIRYTGLSLSQVRHGLAVLIQQHLAIWSSGEPAFYEGYWPAAYALVRSGKIAKAARDRLDESAEQILTQCLLNGDVNANDLEYVHTTTAGSSVANGIDGSSHEINGDQESHESEIYSLLEQGFIVLSNASHFRTTMENLIAAEGYVKSVRTDWLVKIKPAERPIFHARVRETMMDRRYGSGEVKKAIQERSLDGTFNLKRLHQRIEGVQDEDDYQPSKKLKLSSHTHAGTSKGSFDPDMVVRPNHDKYAVLARSQRLVQLAADRIGIPTSRVYAAVLRLLDKDIMRCNEFERDAETPMMDDRDEQRCIKIGPILESLGSCEDLQSAIGAPCSPSREKSSPSKGNAKKRGRMSDKEGTDSDSDIVVPKGRLKPNGKVKTEEPSSPFTNGKGKGKLHEPSTPTTNGKGKGKQKAEVRIAYEQDSDSSPPSPTAGHTSNTSSLRQHLSLLVDHSLLHHHPPSGTIDGKESWSIPFLTLSHTLRVLEINTTLSTLFGAPALRLVSILQRHGKLDEKTLVAYSLLSTKLLRSTLSSLHTAGYLELQEVPRDNSRAPSKTLYLWFFDEERCSRRLLDDYYQGMSRCLQRLRTEREGVAGLLAKSQRSDVRGREREFLQGEEWKRFERWKEVEEMLLGEVGRLDEGVVVLRDL